MQMLQLLLLRCMYQELVGICKWALGMRAAASPDALRCCLDVMRFWSRLGLQKIHPEETAIMYSWFDDVLVQAPSITA